MKSKFYNLKEALEHREQAKELIYHNFYRDKINEIEQISQLSALETLFMYHLPEGVNFDFLLALPQLEVLAIQDAKLKHIPTQIQQMPQLKKLILSYNPIQQINDEEASWQTIEFLDLQHTHLQQIPDKVIQKLSNLKYLDIKHTPIQKLSDNIHLLSHLEILNIENTNIQQLPDNFALLCLKKLYAGFTPFFNRLGEKERKIAELLQKIDNPHSEPEAKKLYFKLFLNQHEALKITPENRHFLIEALNNKNQLLRLNALEFLHTRAEENPFLQIEKELYFYVAGKVFTEVERLNEQLEEKGLHFSNKMHAKTTHILVGEYPRKATKTIVQSQLPIVSQNCLHEYWQKQQRQTYYLTQENEETEEMIERLSDLLQSNELSNQLLALEIMLGAGIPQKLLYEVIMCYIWQNNTKVKQISEILLEKFLPNTLVLHLKRNVRTAYNMPNEATMTQYLKNLLHPLLSADALGLTFYQKTGKGKKFCFDYPEAFLHICQQELKNKVLFLGSLGLKNVNEALGEMKMVKILYLQQNHLESLPYSLETMNHLRLINLTNNHLQIFPEVLYQLETLTDLNLSNNKIKFVADEIATMHTLKRLNLSKNRIISLPESIAQLSQLERLVLTGNPITKNEATMKKLQEWLPHCEIY
ncbi:MAG: leucine-rich repeat domain-containing protein [Cytophagales bacterium]|nr:MAG: leucine-rich repeat domain-containing protein [Cytophagales bacterium]